MSHISIALQKSSDCTTLTLWNDDLHHLVAELLQFEPCEAPFSVLVHEFLLHVETSWLALEALAFSVQHFLQWWVFSGQGKAIQFQLARPLAQRGSWWIEERHKEFLKIQVFHPHLCQIVQLWWKEQGHNPRIFPSYG